MASPQPDQHTRISNELLEAICRYPFTSNEFRVILFIVRKTYGYHKKVINLRTKDIAEGVRINKQNIKRTLRSLLESSCLHYHQVEGKHGATYGIQKDYERWKVRVKKRKKVIKLITKSNQVDYKSNQVDYKNEAYTTSIKENLKKERKTTLQVPCNSTEKNNTNLRLSNLLFSLMLENNPKAKKPNLKKWAEDIEKLIRIDKRTPKEIEHVIKWTQKNHFESINILSTRKLRDRFDQLWLKSNKPGAGSKNNLHSRLADVGERWLDK